jgi:dTDP-4-dehydrorhamnose reductase
MVAELGRPRVLVFGAGGMLGRDVMSAFASWCSVTGLTKSDCNIADPTVVLDRTRAAAPTHVVNAAAMTDVDGCELDPDAAYLANAHGAENVAVAATAAGAICLQVSTDFVFDGTSGRTPDEFDVPAPLGHYGRSKLAGEQLVRDADRRHMVVRTGHLYGTGGRNFGSTLLTRLRGGQAVSADNQRRVAPTWVRALTVQLEALIRHAPPGGVYHATCSGNCTWFEFARQLRSLSGAAGELLAVTHTGRAPRPPLGGLLSRRLGPRGLQRMPSWQDGLASYVLSLSPSQPPPTGANA